MILTITVLALETPFHKYLYIIIENSSQASDQSALTALCYEDIIENIQHKIYSISAQYLSLMLIINSCGSSLYSLNQEMMMLHVK